MAGLDPGKVVRILESEYIGLWRNIKKISALVKPHINQSNYDQIYLGEFQETNKSMARGNQKNFINNPTIVRKFGFYADGYYCLATEMVFGSNTSATNWELFRRAIETLTVVFANRFDFVVKHNKYLDMITWDIPANSLSTPVRATACKLNPGVFDDQGNMIVRRGQFTSTTRC